MAAPKQTDAGNMMLLLDALASHRILCQYRAAFPDGIAVDTNDQLFQEVMRVHETTTFQDQSEFWNGQHALATLRQWHPCFALSAGFRAVILATLSEQDAKDPEAKQNVRRQVKALWTYPRTGYGLMSALPALDAQPFVKLANEALALCRPHLALVQGKVYLILDTFRTTFFERCAERELDLHAALPTPVTRPNFETEHVTLVNSDVVAPHEAEFNALLSKAAEHKVGHDLQCTGFNHTVSLDWARFGVCIMAMLNSPSLATWIAQVNDLLGLKLRPQLHITVAVQPRHERMGLAGM